MSDITNSSIPPAAMAGSMRDFRVPGGADLLKRTEGFFKWQDLRRKNGLWPFSRATEDGPGTTCRAQDDSGNKMRGVNFASQDYLSLSQHSGIKATAKETIERCGVLAGDGVDRDVNLAQLRLGRRRLSHGAKRSGVARKRGWRVAIARLDRLFDVNGSCRSS